MIYNDDISTWKHVWGREGMTVMETSSGLGMGSRKNPWKNSWKTMFRDLNFASVYELARKIILTSSSKKFDSSLSLSLCSLDFYSPRVTNLRKVREEGGGIIVPFVE